MRMVIRNPIARGVGLAAGLLPLLLSGTIPAQTPPTPSSAVPPAAEVSEGSTREQELEARVRQLESLVEQLSRQVQSISSTPPAPQPAPDPEGAEVTPSGGATAPGQSSPYNPPPSDRFEMPLKNPSIRSFGRFGPGFEWRTADEEYTLQFHNLTQVDGRFYQQAGQEPVADTFALPRQWFMFSGRLTKPLEYFVSLANGFDTVTTLDDFLNVHYDDRLQFKIGRYKTPFTYEFYTEPVQGLIVPERSLFFNNFALNRAVGMMAWGQLIDKRLDYAVGIFNTNRNGFADTSDGKNVLAYLNYRVGGPEGNLFENLSFGGSVDSGNQFSAPPIPATLRTIVPTTGNSVFGVPFLSFNPGVQESGNHTLWDLHLAWYYRHLSLISEWGSGRQPYSPVANANARTQLPIQSWYVQAGYFLTGETVATRGLLKPLRPFDVRKGKQGPGALEVFGRYNYLNIGREVFTNQLANPDLWTNQLYLVDVGFNWYWTAYVRMTFDWEHAEFGNPVLYNTVTGARQINSDLFWVRFQVFF
jgi:phosphate-selective porin OprO/OprP